jgi:hypothetical protein
VTYSIKVKFSAIVSDRRDSQTNTLQMYWGHLFILSQAYDCYYLTNYMFILQVGILLNVKIYSLQPVPVTYVNISV